MRVFFLKIWLLLVGGALPLGAAAQSPAEPPFTIACSKGARVGAYKEQFCEVRDFTLSAPVGQPLVVSGATSSTAVYGWDGPNVRIKALVQSGGASAEEAQAHVQDISVVAAGNSLRATTPDDGVERLIRYQLFVPRHTALVVTTGGNLRLENIQARIEFRGGTGNVLLSGLGGQVTGSIGTGNLTVALTGQRWEGEGLDVRTANGNVWWQMSADYSARLLLSTTNGRFFSPYPVAKVDGRQEVATTVGQGGALLKAATTNGTVYFRKEDGGLLVTRSAEAVSPADATTALKKALVRANLPAADSLLAQARRLGYVPGQVVALAQLATRSQAQDPAAATARLQEATRLAGQCRDVGEAGWVLGQVSRLQSRLARQAPALADFYAPLLQALSDAMNASAAFNTPAVPREATEAVALAASEKNRVRRLGMGAGMSELPAIPAVPGLPADALPRFGMARRLLDTLLAGRPASPQVARQLQARRKQLDRSQALSTAFAKEGDYAKAYQYYVQYTAYKDSLTAEATTRRLASLEYRQSLLRKEAQIQRLTKERLLRQQDARRQAQSVAVLAGCVAVLLLFSFILSRNNRARRRANLQLNEQKEALQHALADLKTAQVQLVQREKMASLGELTAGIAHEIQNPLNFVNNFSDVSAELAAELAECQQQPTRDPALEAELLADVQANLLRIHQHGHRASAIVKGMLEHARTSTGQKEPTDLNALLLEYAKLAYHSARAKDKAFEAELTPHLDGQLAPVLAAPQELSRVLLNIFTNAFYAVQQKSRTAGPTYRPEVQVSTQRVGSEVVIRIRDNGLGIPEELRQKVFQPFFTTKPTGEGTGLGLSLSYDIITKGHGGTLGLESEAGRFTEFTITLPVAGPIATQPAL